MKKYFIYLLFVIIGLEACYVDKGSYDYNPIAPVEMSGIDEEYKVQSMIGQLKVSPQFPGKEDYNFMWILFSNTIVQPQLDTISREPDLDYKVTENADTYTLQLTIEHKNTGDRQFFTTKVIVNTLYTSGCYLLKEVNGKTDIDLITTEWELVENILNTTSTQIDGKPMSFAVCDGMNYIDDEGKRNERAKTVWITSDQDARMMRLESMKPVYDIGTMFYEEKVGETPRNLLSCALKGISLCYLSNNGYYDMALNVYSAAHKFGFPLKVSNPETGESLNCSASKYAFTGLSYCMFYDESNSRFLLAKNGSLYRFSEFDKYGRTTFSPNNMNCDLLYMGGTTTSGVALTRDKSDNKYYAYQLETKVYDGYKGDLFSPLLKRVELPESLNTVRGEVFGNNGNSPYIYSSIGAQLNMFDILSGTEQANILPGLDGNITLIKHLRATLPQLEAPEFLVIATENGGSYKIYLYEMLAGKPNLSKQPKIVEGKGKIADFYKI